MATTKYSDQEWAALDKKIESPNTTVFCPRCGKELRYSVAGNSCEARCSTEGCIKETVRGL